MKWLAMDKLTGSRKKVRMHFAGTVATVCVLFILCVACLWAVLGRYDSSDVADYQKLMQNQDDTQGGNAYTSRQRRVGVQKDVFFIENDQHLQLRLQSAHTQLALDHHDGQTELVEHMHDVTCYIQEELFYKLADGREALRQEDGRLLIKHADPKEVESWIENDKTTVEPVQIIRLVEADTAFYYYKNNQFLAENVKITHYIAPGHNIEQAAKSEKLLMSGIATWVEFSLTGNDINFKACQLKAKLYAPRGLEG